MHRLRPCAGPSTWPAPPATTRRPSPAPPRPWRCCPPAPRPSSPTPWAPAARSASLWGDYAWRGRVDAMTADTFFSRDELLGGLPARRASTLLFAIESRTAHLVAQARQAMARFVTEKTAAERERAFLEALAQGRNPPIQPTIQDLERYAPDWADLAPEEPGIRAAVAKLLGQKYTFTARDVPQLRQALGLDDAAVQASYQRSYGQPLASIFAPAVGRRERLRWAWANLAGRLENLPPFWTAFALTLTETVTEGLLALPIALAGVGPLAGVVLLVVFGLINMLTIAAMSESIVRNGNMRYGHAYLGRLVSDYLGGAGSLLMFMAFLILSVVALLACGVGLATTLADATGIPAVAWVAALFLVNLAVLRRESLDATVASALLIGGGNVALIIILSLLALPHVRAANLLYTNVPFVGGRPFDASVLGLIFGVILVAYLGHASAANCAKVVLRRDPGGRALIWGSVAALGCATALYALCIVAINGAVAPELLAHATGTALQPLAAQVEPAVLALGAVYVVLSLGLGSVHESLSLFFQVREWLPAERPIQPEERAANGQEVATRPWFSVDPAGARSWFLDRRGRFWLGVAPVALIFLLVEWLLLTERASFAGSIGFLGTIAAPLLGGIFPLLLLAASRRTGDYTPSLVFRLLGHPAVIVGLYALFLASIFLHGLLIWRDPFERMAALFVGLLTLAATVASLRRGVLRPRAAIELRLDRAAGGAANFNVTVAGRPATASVRLVYANGERRLRAASGVIEVFGDLRSAAFHLPASAARELKVWAHQLTPAGDTRPLPARLAIHDGTAIQRCDLRESDGQAIVPIGQAPYQAQLTFVNLPAVRPAAPPSPAARARPWRPAAALTTCALAAVVAILGGWALPAAGPPQSAFAEPGFPLDPLSAAETRTAVAVLKQDGKLAPDAIFPVIRLHEPPKAEVLRFAPGQPLRREAAVTAFNRSQNKTYQAIVDVRNARLLDLRELPGVQPLITNTEYYEVPPLVRSDPRWQAAMRRRGIADFEHVYLDVWAPGENAVPYALPDSPIRRRAAFLNHHLWATRYQSEELAAAGPYPNQSKGSDGLVKYSADDASLVDQDLVLWYTLGVTHIPRPEEWPVMPTTHAGFRLIPAGFFAQNPGLDVPGTAKR